MTISRLKLFAISLEIIVAVPILACQSISLDNSLRKENMAAFRVIWLENRIDNEHPQYNYRIIEYRSDSNKNRVIDEFFSDNLIWEASLSKDEKYIVGACSRGRHTDQRYIYIREISGRSSETIAVPGVCFYKPEMIGNRIITILRQPFDLTSGSSPILIDSQDSLVDYDGGTCVWICDVNTRQSHSIKFKAEGMTGGFTRIEHQFSNSNEIYLEYFSVDENEGFYKYNLDNYQLVKIMNPPFRITRDDIWLEYNMCAIPHTLRVLKIDKSAKDMDLERRDYVRFHGEVALSIYNSIFAQYTELGLSKDRRFNWFHRVGPYSDDLLAFDTADRKMHTVYQFESGNDRNFLGRAIMKYEAIDR